MKENKKASILIILAITLTLAIILITILYITKKREAIKPTYNNNVELYSLWYVYKQEIVGNDEIIDTFNTNNLYLNITKDQISICDIKEANKTCTDVNYTYNDNDLKISDNMYFNGKYKVAINNNIMVLEKIENEERKVSIKYYLQKPSG